MNNLKFEHLDFFERKFGIGDIILWVNRNWAALAVMVGCSNKGKPRLIRLWKSQDGWTKISCMIRSRNDLVFLMGDAALSEMPNQQLIMELKKIQYEVKSVRYKG